MKICLVSDTHIHNSLPPMPEVEADVCVLAGDIGVLKYDDLYSVFLSKLRERFPSVILVLGNHEFYDLEYRDAFKKAVELTKKNDVHLLDVFLGTQNLEIGGVHFWGSTLWSDLNKGDYFARQAALNNISDTKIIKNFTIAIMLETFWATESQINWDADVAISHYRPILRKHSDLPFSDNTYGFCATTLTDKIYESKIKFWMHGHTHDNVTDDVGGTMIVSNQLMGACNSRPYDPKFFVEV